MIGLNVVYGNNKNKARVSVVSYLLNDDVRGLLGLRIAAPRRGCVIFGRCYVLTHRTSLSKNDEGRSTTELQIMLGIFCWCSFSVSTCKWVRISRKLTSARERGVLWSNQHLSYRCDFVIFNNASVCDWASPTAKYIVPVFNTSMVLQRV